MHKITEQLIKLRDGYIKDSARFAKLYDEYWKKDDKHPQCEFLLGKKEMCEQITDDLNELIATQ